MEITSASIAIIAAIGVLVAFSAYFSASEMAFASLNKIRLKNLAKDGNKKAQRALNLSENFDKMLTTILIGNTVVNLLASSLCTILFVSLLSDSQEWLQSLMATAVITLLILMLGEITPKSVAKENAENVAMALSSSLSKMVWLFTPFSRFFIRLKNGIARRSKKKDGPTLTEEELIVMIDEIEEEGTLEKHESDLIKSAIEFDDITADEILTPRVDVKGVDINADRYEIKYVFSSTGFSRLVVFDEKIDTIIGAISVKDFYNRYFDSEEMGIEEIIRPVMFIPESTKISMLMKDMQTSKMHLAVVLDEYGGTVGIVTLEDITEELVGEIWDESDEVQYSVLREDDGTYTVLGGANVYDVMEELELEFDPEEFEDHTIAGFIQYKLGRIPVKNTRVELDNATMVVKSTKNRRIREVKIIKKELPPEEDES